MSRRVILLRVRPSLWNRVGVLVLVALAVVPMKGHSLPPSYDLRRAELADVVPLIERHHGYGGVGNVATAVWAVYEHDRIVAAYVWNPPAPGAALAVAPAFPSGVLALTRMVAVPREERQLRHVSTPLRRKQAFRIVQIADRHAGRAA